MIATIPHRTFKKKFKKLKRSEQQAVEERLLLFVVYPFAPILNNHAPHGKYMGKGSINITGDLRLIFEMITENIAYLIDVDTHPKLYT